jgi:serine/threonine protein kinase
MSAAVRAARGKALLLPQQIVTSPETKLQYRVESLLGQGGFGQAYLATRITRSRAIPAVVAMKASEHIDGWLREAYFGQILEGHSRAIRVYEAFPLAREDGSVLYCLALEHAKHGDLRSYLQKSGKDGRRGPRGARSRGSWRSWASSTVDSCSIATSRR